MSDSHEEGGLKVTVSSPHETAVKLTRFLNAQGVTAAQYASGKAACVKRARGDTLTAQEEVLADRFTALMAAAKGDQFDVT